ncbi:type VI secretion system-associated FHA domain protein TagH [soil metagenome]
MITLTVSSFHGSAYTGAPLSASFGETGGTIGRADSNLLVLPDPDRTISRVHAQIACRSGQFFVQDHGSNPIALNGQLLGEGGEQVLCPGDELLIGGFCLKVAAGAVAPKPSPTAALPAGDDIFTGLFGASAGSGHDPLQHLFATSSPPAAGGAARWSAQQPGGNHPMAAPTAAPRSASNPGAGIPDDWDPFGSKDSTSAKPGAVLRDIAQGMQRRAETSLDDLYGLGASAEGGGRAADPLAGSALFGPSSGPNTAADADPMRSFQLGGQAAAAQSEPDFGSDLYSPMPLPKTTPSARLMPEAAPAPATPASGQFSWGDSSADAGRSSHTIIRPVVRAKHGDYAEPAARPLQARADAPAPADSVAPVAAVPAPAGNHAALLRAFQNGLGVADDLPLELTPELMLLVGRLLRESAQGTVDLLVARAALKREVRAEVTMIVARENNPLKFSPSADVALRHLLGKPTRGFMPPAEAMADAYTDLRAHQFGMLAGMRAALEGVLERFDPVHLEARLTQKSVLGSLLPSTRKARMWELFNELYAQIRAEASDDFQRLFGKAFLQAYEAHIDALQQEHREP